MILKHSLPALLILTALGGCGSAASTDLAEVDQALAQHRFADARNQLLAIREDDKSSIETNRRLALLELEIGDGYAAERYLDEWRRATGETPEWVTQRARSLILQGKARSARDFLESAEPAEAEAPRRAWLKVWATMEEGNNARALDEVMVALSQYPQSADLNARAGRLMALQGDREAANRYLTAALAVAPQHYEALLLQGEGRIAAGDLEGALESYRIAAKGYPDFAVPHANVAGLLIDLGRLQEAEQALKPALARYPGFPLLKFTAARLQAANKRWAQARTILQAMPTQFKRDVPAAILLEADAEAALGNQAMAQSLYASIANRPGLENVVAERMSAGPPA